MLFFVKNHTISKTLIYIMIRNNNKGTDDKDSNYNKCTNT